MDVKTAVYRLYDEHGVLLYVGIGSRPQERIVSHMRKPWGSQIAYRRIEWLDSRRDALIAEAEAIKNESPLYNIAQSQIRHVTDGPMLPLRLDLVGCAEISALLGVTRQRVQQLTKTANFPTPVAELTGGSIWLASDIRKWAAATGRRVTKAA